MNNIEHKNITKNITIDYETDKCGLENMYRGVYNTENNEKYYCRFTGNIDSPYWDCLQPNFDPKPVFNPDDNNTPYSGEVINLGTNIFGSNQYLLCEPNKSLPIKKKSLQEIESLAKEKYPLPDCGIDSMYKGLFLDENNEYNIYCRYIKSESENENKLSFLCTGQEYSLIDDFPQINNNYIPYDGRKLKKINSDSSLSNIYGYNGNYRNIPEETFKLHYYSCPPNISDVPPPMLKPYCGSKSKSKGWYKVDENSDQEYYCRDIEISEKQNDLSDNVMYTLKMVCDPKDIILPRDGVSIPDTNFEHTHYNKSDLLNIYKNRPYDGGYFDCPSDIKNNTYNTNNIILIILSLVILCLTIYFIFYI